jgi:glycosyltransferase involved in cell wall biosynthesis
MVTTEGLRVGFIGRLEAKKNLDLMLRALPRVGPNVSLAVAGDGAEGPRLRRLAEEIGVTDQVSWLGFVDGEAKEDFFRHIDLLVMPSDYECFGMAGGEALSAGVPLLVTHETGIGEVIEAGGGGEIIVRDPNDIAAAIEKLLHNPKRLAQYSQAAAAAAEAALSFAAHGAAIRRHYEYLLSPPATPAP